MPQALTPEQRERARIRAAVWHQENRERRLAKMRADYAANPEKKLAKARKYHQEHPEISREAARRQREANPESGRARNRKWYREHIEEERIRAHIKNKKAFAENREAILKRNREWAARNKDKIRQRDLRRRALLKGAKINLAHIAEWMGSIKAKRFVCCYYCDKKVPTDSIHFDHIVALSKGGVHAVENLCVSCASCNCSKQAKSITAWVRIGQQVLEL